MGLEELINSNTTCLMCRNKFPCGRGFFCSDDCRDAYEVKLAIGGRNIPELFDDSEQE